MLKKAVVITLNDRIDEDTRGRKLGKYIISKYVMHVDGEVGIRRINHSNDKKEASVLAHSFAKEEGSEYINAIENPDKLEVFMAGPAEEAKTEKKPAKPKTEKKTAKPKTEKKTEKKTAKPKTPKIKVEPPVPAVEEDDGLLDDAVNS
jgi:chromatin remodeling complex protein RSC6